MNASFTKRASRRAIAAEAAGLAELGHAARAGGAPVVRLLRATSASLETARLAASSASPAAAVEFGRRLAFTHAFCPEGSRVFGQAPAGLVQPDGTADDGVMGAAELPLTGPGRSRPFGEFYAEDRLLPYLSDARGNGSIDVAGAVVIERLAERLRDGHFDSPQPALVRTDAALIHGDLWAGNIMWVPRESAEKGAEGFDWTEKRADWPAGFGEAKNGAKEPARIPARNLESSPGDVVGVLIDPACHGGHAESDLAQLTVFGAPYVDRIYAAYDEASPLADGWHERAGLHRLHMLIVHAALFGGGYGRQTVDEAQHYV